MYFVFKHTPIQKATYCGIIKIREGQFSWIAEFL